MAYAENPIEGVYAVSTLVVPSSPAPRASQTGENTRNPSVEQTIWERKVLDLDRTIAQNTSNGEPFVAGDVAIEPVLDAQTTARVRGALNRSIAAELSSYPYVYYVSLAYGGIFHTRELLRHRMQESAKRHMSVLDIRGTHGTDIQEARADHLPESLTYAHLTIVHDDIFDKGGAFAALVARLSQIRHHTPYAQEFVAKFSQHDLSADEKQDLFRELVARMEQERVVMATPVYKNPWFVRSMDERLSQSNDECSASWAAAMRRIFPHHLTIDPSWWLMGDGLDTGIPVPLVAQKAGITVHNPNLTLRIGSTIPGLVKLRDTHDAYKALVSWVASTIA